MPAEGSPPRVFVSYSHDDERHKAWVLALASRLVANGVDVILDRWNLTLGSDLAHFMESGLSDADRVLAICTDLYVGKANRGIGGVGYEKMILTAQVMADLHQGKVIPVLRANETGVLPAFLETRVYLDFRTDASFEQRYVELVRELHGQRIIARPPLGANPFSDGATPVLAHRPERYVSPDLSGTVTFDYSNNDGFYTVGLGDLAFNTRWSRSGTTSIFVYRDGAQIQSVAIATGVSSLADLKDASVFDDSSRVRQPILEDVVVWRNARGYYLATKIERISIRYRNEWKDEVTFSYVIQPNRTPVFSD